ncbi:hypothetical protein [Streptomyces sp. NPDC003327]
MLTAALLTPARFPSVLGDDFPEACAALGLTPYEEGYGLIFGQDGLGARWTVVVDDVSLVAAAIASWDCGMAYDLSPDENAMVAGLPGWPLEVVSVAPGVPAPHDPEPEEGDPAPLTPPSGDVWGPAQRRLGADEVALHWAAWRAQVDEDGTAGASPRTEGGTASAAVGTAAAGTTAADAGRGDTAAASGRGDTAETDADADRGGAPDPYDGVRRALRELRGYLEEPPPVGRVRSTFLGEDARILRADGPGWSLVARTDDMAFVLLDDVPREVLPVARGPQLPALLEALDAMAVRPF